MLTILFTQPSLTSNLNYRSEKQGRSSLFISRVHLYDVPGKLQDFIDDRVVQAISSNLRCAIQGLTLLFTNQNDVAKVSDTSKLPLNIFLHTSTIFYVRKFIVFKLYCNNVFVKGTFYWSLVSTLFLWNTNIIEGSVEIIFSELHLEFRTGFLK